MRKREKRLLFLLVKTRSMLLFWKSARAGVRLLPIKKELCPRGICAHTGWISRNFQSIVCIPNRIVVSFSDKKLDGVDGVTY